MPIAPAVTRLLVGTVALARAGAVESLRCPGTGTSAEPVAR
ncbi:hypothetical protein AB0J89_12925 [Micromonospora chokoriensis]